MGVVVSTSVAPPTSGTITTSLETSVTYDNVTWFFNTAVPVGRFEAGIKDGAGNYPPFVLSTDAFQITSTSPASAVVGTYKAHGMVKDPYTRGDGGQGWDQQIQFQANLNAGSEPIYVNALNVDPGNTGSAISVAQGEVCSFTKAVRRAGATTSTFQQLDRYCTLTVLDTAPPTGSFMPSPSETGSKTLYSKEDINWTALRSLSMPSSLPDYSTILPYIPPDMGQYGYNDYQQRWFRLDDALDCPYHGESPNYSPDPAFTYCMYAIRMHEAGLATSTRDEIVERIVQWGIQINGLISRGWDDLNTNPRAGGSGQHGAYHFTIYCAAFLLNDAAMLANAQGHRSHIDGPKDWIKSSDIGQPVQELSDSKNYRGIPFTSEMVDTPWSWPEEQNANVLATYRAEDASISSWELLLVESMQNGPGGVSGTEAFLNGATLNDTSSTRAAAIAFQDKLRSWTERLDLARSYWITTPSGETGTPPWLTLYDTIIADIGRVTWTGKPDRLSYGNGALGGTYDDDMFSAGDGAVSHTINGRDYSTLPVTRYDVRYSMDGGVQWKLVQNAGSSGSTTLLKQQEYYCQIRQVDSAGDSPWSVNIPSDDLDANPGIVTTSGTDTAAAPAVDVPPVIMYNATPQWEGDEFYEAAPIAPTELDAENLFLALGGGHWTGYPAPTLTYQWQRADTLEGAWSNISTAKLRTRTSGDAGKYLRGQVTATNASAPSGIRITTNAVKVPDLTELPAGSLIDTQFQYLAAIDYETEITAAQASVVNGTLLHEPAASNPDNLSSGTATTGWLRIDKAGGSNPSFILPLQQAAVAGMSYSITAKLIAYSWASYIDWDGSVTVTINNATGDTITTITKADPNPSGTDGVSYLLEIDEVFSIGSAISDLDLRAVVSHNTNRGLAEGGDLCLSEMTIRALWPMYPAATPTLTAITAASTTETPTTSAEFVTAWQALSVATGGGIIDASGLVDCVATLNGTSGGTSNVIVRGGSFKDLSLINVQNLRFEDMVAVTTPQTASAGTNKFEIEMDGCTNIQFIDCRVTYDTSNAVKQAYYLGGTARPIAWIKVDVGCSNILFDGCYIEGYFTGIECHNSSNVEILNTEINNTQMDDIRGGGWVNVRIDGCYIHDHYPLDWVIPEGFHSDMIQIWDVGTPCDGIEITNSIFKAGSYGGQTIFCNVNPGGVINDVLVENCLVYANHPHGISFFGGVTNGVIRRNTVLHNTESVYETNGVPASVVPRIWDNSGGNLIQDNVCGQYTAGSGTILSGNYTVTFGAGGTATDAVNHFVNPYEGADATLADLKMKTGSILFGSKGSTLL